MSDGGDQLEYAKLCVQAANAIVVFAVIQTLAFGYALGREPVIREGVKANLGRVKGAILAATLFYIALIAGLGFLENGVLDGRIGGSLIAGFTILSGLVVAAVGAAAYGIITLFRETPAAPSPHPKDPSIAGKGSVTERPPFTT